MGIRGLALLYMGRKSRQGGVGLRQEEKGNRRVNLCYVHFQLCMVNVVIMNSRNMLIQIKDLGVID